MTFTATGASLGVLSPNPTHRRTGLERAICFALALGIAVQVTQRFLFNGQYLSEYGRSLWYVTYQFGFVRRGLAGEVLRTVLGSTPSLRAVDLVQNLLALLMLAVAMGLVALLCRQRTVIGYATAAVLVIAPFGFDAVGGQRRPDLVGFLLLAVISIWAATRHVQAVALGLVGGALLAVSALVSEVSPLIVGPWLVLVVAAAARAHGATRLQSRVAMLLAAVPSIAVLGVLVTMGRATPQTVAALERVAPPEINGHGSVFDYLGDTFRGSVVRVIEGPTRLVLSIAVGVLLSALLIFCVRAGLPYISATFRWILPTRLLRRVWALGMLAGAALLFVLGLDWLRWITSFAFAGLLAAGAVVALTDRSRLGPPGRNTWRRPVPDDVTLSIPGVLTAVVGVYLLLLPPLPNWIRSVGSGARLLLDIPV